MTEFLNDLPNNKEIVESFLVAKSKLENVNYDKVAIAVSGGSDSDIMLDLCHRVDKYKKLQYIWFDTGLEYQATKVTSNT